MRISALLFDFGGTLERAFWDEERALKTAEKLIQKLRGLDIHILEGQRTAAGLLESIVAAYQIDRERRERTLRESSTTVLWRDILGGTSDIPVGTTEELTAFFEEHAFIREPVAEIVPLLFALQKRGVRLGVVSNVITRTRVPDALVRYQLQHYFEVVVMSSVYGVRKPHPAIFHHAALQLNVPSRRVGYVGDRIDRDVLGSRRAGCGAAIHYLGGGDAMPRTGISIQNTATFPKEFLQPHLVTNDPAEILKYVDTRNSAQILQADEPRRRALVFDAADVLYYRSGGNNRLHKILKSAGVERTSLHEPEPEALQRVEMQANQGHIDTQEYRRLLLALWGITDEKMAHEVMRAMERHSDGVETMPGVPETLAALHARGVLLAVVSNSALPMSKKLSFFESGGYGHFWDSVVISSEVGVAKPNPEIYRIALRQLSIPSAQAAFVGHEQHELDGARLAGMLTVAFNGVDLDSDYRIDHFSELSTLPFLAG